MGIRYDPTELGGTEEPLGVVWKDDGTKFYVLGNQGNIFQYSASPAWTVESATYDSKSAAPTELGSFVSAVFIGDSGTKVFFLDTNNNTVRRYTLSTAWDISTIGGTEDHNYSINTQDPLGVCMTFKPDGTVMYIACLTGADISQYTLTTAWDLSGTVTYNHSTSISANSNNTGGNFQIKSDGLKFFIRQDGSGAANYVNEYSMSPAWDMSSLAYVAQFSVNSETTAPASVDVKSDGTRMWVGDLNSPKDIIQYEIDTAWDVTSALFNIPITADGEVTLAQTVAGTASTNHHHADGAVTVTPTVTAGATNNTNHCAGAVTLTPTVTATGRGTLHADGAVATAQTVSAVAQIPPHGEGAVTITPTITGTTSTQVSMVVDATLPPLEATGFIEYNLVTLPLLTVDAFMENAKQTNLTLPSLTATGEMIAGNLYTSGVSMRLPMLQVSAYADNRADMILPSLTISATMISSNVARGDIRLPSLTITATMGDARVLDVDVTLPVPYVSRGTLINEPIAVGDMRLPTLEAFGVLNSGTAIVGDISLPALNMEGLGSTLISEGLLTANLTLPALEAVGYITFTATLTHSGWSFNTESMRTSEYDNYDYLLLTNAFGKKIGVAADGIYELTGDTDNTVDINADVLFGLDSFRTEDLKRVKAVHLGYRADNSGDLNVQIVVDGEAQIREYIVRHISSASGIKRGRATIAKGLKSRYWQYGIKNVAGADFMIDDLNVYVQQHNRKVQ